MLLKPLTVAAGLLAVPAAHAFLLPPEISDADIQIANTIESVAAQVVDVRTVDLECPDCPILVRGRRGRPIQVKLHRPSNLSLTFSVDHQPDHDRLLVNGFELYPTVDPLEVLEAPQVVNWEAKPKPDRRRKEHHRHDGKRGKRPHRLTPQPQRLGFGLHVGPAQKNADGTFELVEVDLQILEVGMAFIDGVPDVKLKLIKDGQGRLLMSQVEKSAAEKLLELPNDRPEECNTKLCRLLAAARAKFQGLRPHKPCHGAAVAEFEAPNGPSHPDAPRPHHPHGDHWRGPFHVHRWGALLKHVAAHIFLPVLIGIVAGVSVSL